MNLEVGLLDLAVVTLVAALAPILAGLLPRSLVPQVVILIVGGIVIGPQVLGWAEPKNIELFSNLGLGFLFLLAGYELDLGLFRAAGRPARHHVLAGHGRGRDRGDRRAWRRSASSRRSYRSRSA